jgi:ADP-heptose:LPS heptosyltransferase
MEKNKIIFKQWQAPGDLLMLSVALRDLHKSYPCCFETDVFSCYPEVFFNNPNIVWMPKNNGVPMVDVKYDIIRDFLAPKGYHFSDVFIFYLNELLCLNIQKTSMRPDIHLTENEKSENLIERLKIKKPYWLINTGIKMDIPIKGYPPSMWQKVINSLHDYGFNLYQVGSLKDIHPVHDNVHNLVGLTENIRDYFSLAYHSEGSIGHVSLHMHVSAAFNKKCVVVAGGREDWTWEAYPTHRYLHSIGQYDCCQKTGCWISTVDRCKYPFKGWPYATCIASIQPDEIVNNVLDCATKDVDLCLK